MPQTVRTAVHRQQTRRSCHYIRYAAVLCALLVARVVSADPVRVRYPEGPAHGFLILTDTADKPLAHGERIQWLEKGVVASELIFRFDDGSLYDETARFSQKDVFRLESYHLVQKGPSFSTNIDEQFDRSGKYAVRSREADTDEKTLTGTTEIPRDTYNGMTPTILKNLTKGASAKTHLLAFTPKPRILELHSTPEDTDKYWVGGSESTATRFLIKPDVPGLTGVVATVIGKQPPSFRMWIAQGNAPVLVRFEGPLYAEGPPWRIGLSAPRFDGPNK